MKVCPYLILFVTLLVSDIILLARNKKPKYLILRFSLLFTLFSVGLYFFPFFQIAFLEMGYIVSLLASVFFLWIVYGQSFRKAIFFNIFSWAVQNGVHHLHSLFCIFVEHKPTIWETWGLTFVFSVAISTLFYFIYIRKTDERDIDRISTPKFIFSSGFTIFIVFVLSGIVAKVDLNQTIEIVCHIFSIVCCIFAMCIQFGLFGESEFERRNEMMEQILEREREQWKISQETIEMINIKCHDLKHQISQLRENDGNKRKKRLKEIEKSAIIYDSIAKTGNKSLDITLTEKGLICENRNIRFTYMVDALKLNFMDTLDVYSLFGNILDNAIESVSEVADEEKRIVSLTVKAKDKLLKIYEENYCEHPIVFEKGLPVTTKKDRRLHGFGMSSIRLIVNKYGGTMAIDVKNNVFKIGIVFPI